ncbi:MAG: phosphoenolpyruvate synthase [Theionarchaea archaeon]|nr:MAG: phosphoenolpyruvate synthase [Theionarchaea archaeon DG-70-1]MBU7029304.1 phosphoenolpyruvate synthase [Theionarchaea archaeon]
MSKEFILWFDDIGMEDVPRVGGKSASLGEMTKAEVPVPYGFTTTAHAYQFFLEHSELTSVLEELLRELKDPEDTETLQKVGKSIRKTITEAGMPKELETAIRKAYEELTKKYQKEGGSGEPYVAVRSSATAEDLPDASFAGQQETYLNVVGADELVERVQECFASLFTDRAIYYRIQKGFDHLEVALAAAVQLMVFSEAAGVMFTLNVSNGDRDVVQIEAAYGLGEYVVQGTVTPDVYYAEKEDFALNKIISTKDVMLIRKEKGGVEEKTVPKTKREKQVLSDEQIVQLAEYGISIEEHYKKPMDIEWGLDERTGKLWILQARPETAWAGKAPAKAAEVEITEERKVIVKGLPASPGMVAGKASVILNVSDINKFQQGDILVTEMTAPDWVPAMKKAKAIVTNSGGMTCHAAIVSREMQIPCIVATKNATDIIQNGQDITVDAVNGVVYEGILKEAVAKKEEEKAVMAEVFPVTGTKVLMNLGDPDLADKYAELPCDGIGLMREEFIWTTFIHEHPNYLIEVGQSEKVVDMLAEGFRRVAKALYPRPVVLRLSDFKTSEYSDLKGGEKYEPEEPSSLLGWRGASRYYDPEYVDAFKLELEAVKKVREEFRLKNLWVMIPFCRTVEECEKVITIMKEEGLERGPDFKIWLMAEIPSNIILADKFSEYVDGFSVGSNDLTMLILGADRDNDRIAHIFDERDLAVRRAIHHLIQAAHKHGKTVSICGQAPSVYPEFTSFLIKSGIDSVSVNPDAVKSTKHLVAQVEQRIMLEKATGRGIPEDTDLEW